VRVDGQEPGTRRERRTSEPLAAKSINYGALFAKTTRSIQGYMIMSLPDMGRRSCLLPSY
jgi:hypothetical protein